LRARDVKELSVVTVADVAMISRPIGAVSADRSDENTGDIVETRGCCRIRFRCRRWFFVRLQSIVGGDDTGRRAKISCSFLIDRRE